MFLVREKLVSQADVESDCGVWYKVFSIVEYFREWDFNFDLEACVT